MQWSVSQSDDLAKPTTASNQSTTASTTQELPELLVLLYTDPCRFIVIFSLPVGVDVSVFVPIFAAAVAAAASASPPVVMLLLLLFS